MSKEVIDNFLCDILIEMMLNVFEVWLWVSPFHLMAFYKK